MPGPSSKSAAPYQTVSLVNDDCGCLGGGLQDSRPILEKSRVFLFFNALGVREVLEAGWTKMATTAEARPQLQSVLMDQAAAGASFVRILEACCTTGGSFGSRGQQSGPAGRVYPGRKSSLYGGARPQPFLPAAAGERGVPSRSRVTVSVVTDELGGPLVVEP